MTKDKLDSVFRLYADALRSAHPGLAAERLTDELSITWSTAIGSARIASHMLYMCEQAQVFIREERIEKSMRWLGFLQGALWSMPQLVGISVTLDDLKRHSMPDGKANP